MLALAAVISAFAIITSGFSPVAAPLTLMPLPPGPVVVKKGSCPSYEQACMDWSYPPVLTFSDTDSLHRSLLHELGHAFDFYALSTTGLRQEYAAIDGRPWMTPASEERFAQSYALCANNRVLRGTVRSTYYAFRVTPAQHQKVCALIRRAAATVAASQAAAPATRV